MTDTRLPYGFTVERTPSGKWGVYLPHMCDDWHISEAYTSVSQEQAIADLEAFLTEGQLALHALKHGYQYRDGDVLEPDE